MDTCKLQELWAIATKSDTGKTLPVFYEVGTPTLSKFAGLVLSEMNHFNDVKIFQQKFGHLVHEQPVYLTQRKLLERIKFMQEELDEFTQACGFKRVWGELNAEGAWVDGDYYENTGSLQDLPGQADALIDLCYVAKGTGVMLGLPWQQLWADVQRANMTKVRGTTHRGNLVDCVKPAGWQPPMTAEILLAAGWVVEDALNSVTHKDDQEWLAAAMANKLS